MTREGGFEMRINSIINQQGGTIVRSVAAGLLACATFSLAACEAETGKREVDNAIVGAAAQQDIPMAFDTVSNILSAQGYELASCVGTADDKAKLACYAALGFKDKSDLPKVAALAGAAEIMAGKRWQISAPTPGGSDSFQGSALLTLSQLANEGPMAFRNSRITLRCPAKWGGPSNMVWSESIDVPFEMAYDSVGKERGTMTIDVDGKQFNAVQFSRNSFNVAADQAEAFRDSIISAKAISATVKTIDGKTGTLKTTLPDSAESLKGYFGKFCS